MNVARTVRPSPEADERPATGQLEEAFARWQSELLGTLYYLLGNIEDARDALQETFIKCWRHQEKVPEVENLKAWVFRIALNTGRDLRGAAWRQRRKPFMDDGAMLISGQAGPEADLLRREQVERIQHALLTLRSEEQEVFLLRENADMTYDQIAVALRIPVGTVKTRMRLALQKLREALD